MRSLEILIRKWKAEGMRPLPPYGAAIVRATFLQLGMEASRDLIELYSTIGGMEVHDDKLWRLWPLSEVADRASDTNDYGFLFSDYLIDSWAYRVKPDGPGTSKVYVDYFNGNKPVLIAGTLEEFFDKYVRNADRLLTQPG